MCGIIGQINLIQKIDKTLFNQMRDTLTHRGPDGYGSTFLENGNVALGHRRLSIIDLTDNAKQPMANEDNDIWLTYNGEIYNYESIRSDLKDKGHVFRSKSDSEVLIHGYEEWGTEVLSRLKGMFSFAIWDGKKKHFFIARDRFGIKPLYYFTSSSKFIFSSEIKGIIADASVPRDINFNAILDYLTYMYIPSPHSIWQNIHKLPPAHYLIHTLDGDTTIHKYWKLDLLNRSLEEAEALDHFDHLLHESLREHLISDVPVSAFLSGGLDSSTLVHYAHENNYQLDTYSIGFKDFHRSEHEYARIIADKFNTKHTERIIAPDCFELTEKLMGYFDEPFAASSMLPGYIVSNLASKASKVAISGEGGDEILAGYNWYSDITELPKKNAFLRHYKLFSRNLLFNELCKMQTFSRFNYKKLIHSDYIHSLPNQHWFFKKYLLGDLSPVKQLQHIDLNTFLPEACLTRADMCGMANSLEVRVPFLDHTIVEFFFNLKESIYYKNDEKKHLLKKLMVNKLPTEIIHKKKKGFSCPLTKYIQKDTIKDILQNSDFLNSDVFDKKQLNLFIAKNSIAPLWGLLILQLWHNKWHSN